VSQKRHHSSHPTSSVKPNLDINHKPNPRGAVPSTRDTDEGCDPDVDVCDPDVDVDDRGRRRPVPLN
jgi:hypothetical protein